MIRQLSTMVAATVLSAACADGGDGVPSPASAPQLTAHLAIEDGRIVSLHGLKYRIDASDGFAVVGPKHRQDAFNGAPFEISLAAFVSDEAALMVHAERVADGSGASNYDNLPVADWPNDAFRSPGAQCVVIARADTEGEHDLEWLMANGFDPVGSLLFAQYFASTDDYNDEVVLSIIAHTSSCDDNRSYDDDIAALQSQFTVSAAAK